MPANPPAFPRPFDWNGLPHAPEHDQPGMSLRDFFAAKAMQGMVGGLVADEASETLEQLARDAYAIADAMLLERARAAGVIAGQ